MKTKLFLVAFILLVLIGCAEVSHIKFLDPNEPIYGFWSGVWHGMIMVPAFICSLFSDNIAIYAINNNGFWYNFGYVGGLAFLIKLFKVIVAGIKTLSSK
jgi:hypothetical protein